MKKAAVILADGFEEIEAISVADILRRAEIDALLVGLDESQVCGTHGIFIKCDAKFDELKFNEIDMIILPGGLPGATNLAGSQKLGEILREFNQKGKFIAAICAAPTALAGFDLINGEFTCYPGFESEIKGERLNKNVVINKNIITSKGPATAMEFALELVRVLEPGKFEGLKSDLLLA